MPATAEILESARPVIQVDGQDRSELGLGLLDMAVSEDTDGLYSAEATFGNWGQAGNSVSFLYFDRRVLEFGKGFVIKFNGKTLFDGRIVGLEGDFPEGAPPRITVLADDRLQDLRMTRRTRSWASSSDADVLQAIANDHGMSPQIDLSGPTHAALAQVNQSDLAFARERARAAGGELWVEGTTFTAKARSARAGSNPPELVHGRNLRAFRVTADLAHQRTKVTVSGWDVSAKDGVKHDATDSLLGSEVDGGDSGPSVLRSALGDRVDTIVHAGARDASVAEGAANAYFRGISRRFVVGHGTAEGSPELRVGRKVELKGVGPLFNGKYVLVRTRHTFSARGGYRTEFTVERPALGKP
jgi:phage protein D